MREQPRHGIYHSNTGLQLHSLQVKPTSRRWQKTAFISKRARASSCGVAGRRETESPEMSLGSKLTEKKKAYKEKSIRSTVKKLCQDPCACHSSSRRRFCLRPSMSSCPAEPFRARHSTPPTSGSPAGVCAIDSQATPFRPANHDASPTGMRGNSHGSLWPKSSGRVIMNWRHENSCNFRTNTAPRRHAKTAGPGFLVVTHYKRTTCRLTRPNCCSFGPLGKSTVLHRFRFPAH